MYLRRTSRSFLALVGEVVDAEMQEVLAAMLARAGLGDRVVLTGRVDEKEYDEWLSRSKFAVQLRAHSNGETSAAVADCLGAGIGVVASNTGAMAALGTVARLVEPGVSVSDLVTVVAELLASPDELDAMAEQGLRHSSENSFAAAASAVLAEAVSRT